MEVSVSRLSPVEVEVKVLLPKERVVQELSKAYQLLGRTAQLPGFRRGKVPLGHLKRYFGDRVAADVSGRLIEETLPKAIESQKLEPVTTPNVNPEKLQESSDFSYIAKMEVRPTVDGINVEGIELKRQVYTVDDEDINHQLEHLRERHSTLEAPAEPRPVQAGDFVTFDYDVIVDGTAREDLNVRNRTVEVGKGRLLKELDEGVLGMKLQETKEIPVKFPDNHGREELRGKSGVLKLTVSECRQKILPALDDEFAKDVEAESLEELKKKIRGDLEKEGKETAEQKLRDDAVEELVKKNPIAVPPSLVQNAIAAIAREIAQQMRFSGETFNAEEVVKLAETQAEERVRAGLLLAELARKHDLKVTDADINERLEKMAQETKKALARLRAEYRDQKKLETLANSILEDKVLSLLVSQVKVTDTPAGKRVHDFDHSHG